MKEGSQDRHREKGGKKPWVTWLPVWGKEGGGGICHSQTVEASAIFNITCTGGGVLSCSLNPLQCFWAAIIVHYCVRLREEEKKRREQGRERKPVSLCRKDSAGKSFCNYLSLPAKQGSLPPDLQQHFVYCAPLLPYTRATYKCASQAGKTATPGLLLMMRADVRLVSMNIDVEDSLFHRRTEGGKMAAL